MTTPRRVRTSPPGRWRALKPAARELRREATPAEDALWRRLRNGALGVRFRRQHAIDRFIVDFTCLPARLVVEIDGGFHQDLHQRGVDSEREAHLRALGFAVVRFTNRQVLNDMEGVLATIREQAKRQ